MQQTIDEITMQYPDEWVLLGSPVRDDKGFNILSGVVLYHSPDKREVCYLGREKMTGYNRTTLAFMQTTAQKRSVLSILIPTKHYDN